MVTRPAPRQNCRSLVLGWKAILIVVQQTIVFILISKLNNAIENDQRDIASHLYTQYQVDGALKATNNNDCATIRKRKLPGSTANITKPNPQLTLVGISYSDDTTSDFAITFLVEAACKYGIQSYVMLKERTSTNSITKKIKAFAHHMQPLPTTEDYGIVRSPPKCVDWIHISQSPSDDYLMNSTRSRIIRKNDALEESEPDYSFTKYNNPLDKDNRIARIKRSREYQREELRGILELKITLQSDELKNAPPKIPSADWQKNSVIAVLDLDMFAYPSLLDMIETATKYILPPMAYAPDASSQTPNKAGHKTQFHAICANGIFVRLKDGDYYDKRHYDTYSTILLPKNWLFREPELNKKKRKKKGMDQSQTFRHILKESKSYVVGDEGGALIYNPLPVRSCFGGLALYRADVWMDPECRYDIYHEDDAAFTSKNFRHACEHVVFHECLRRKMSEDGRKSGSMGDGGAGFDIAVMPDMLTLWHNT